MKKMAGQLQGTTLLWRRPWTAVDTKTKPALESTSKLHTLKKIRDNYAAASTSGCNTGKRSDFTIRPQGEVYPSRGKLVALSFGRKSDMIHDDGIVVEWSQNPRWYKADIAAMAANNLTSRYIRSLEEADEILSASGASRIRHISYGTVIYTPPFSGKGEEISRIDFGSKIATDKKLVCPRILLISTWTDGKFGFAGGGREGIESPVETMNREFLEEIGTSMNFTIKDDYCFSYMEVLNPNDIRLMSVFCRITSNLVEFNALLSTFHSDTREAYIDEVFTAVGLPLFLEGPDDVVDQGKIHPNSVQGLPKFMNYEGGIFSRRPNHKIYIVREQFLLVLLFKKIISQTLMKRVFFLASIFDDSKEQPSWPQIGTFEDLLERPGVSELLL